MRQACILNFECVPDDHCHTILPPPLCMTRETTATAYRGCIVITPCLRSRRSMDSDTVNVLVKGGTNQSYALSDVMSYEMDRTNRCEAAALGCSSERLARTDIYYGQRACTQDAGNDHIQSAKSKEHLYKQQRRHAAGLRRAVSCNNSSRVTPSPRRRRSGGA